VSAELMKREKEIHRVSYKSVSTDYIKIASRHLLHLQNQCVRDGRCTLTMNYFFEQLLWLLLVTFYWWFVGNKVKFPRNVGIKLRTVPFSAPCIIE
jgi:hypothetical protein